MAGRPPKPTALKELQGTWRPDRANPNEPKPDLRRGLEPPLYVVGDDARRMWDELAPKLHKLGLLTDLDENLLAIYCMEYQRWTQAAKIIASGTVEPNDPIVWQHNKAVDNMLKLAGHFGMSPSTRAKINVPQQTPKQSKIKFRKK